MTDIDLSAPWPPPATGPSCVDTAQGDVYWLAADLAAPWNHGLLYLVVDDADVLTGFAAGSWAISAADVFERRHANTQHATRNTQHATPMMPTLLTLG